MRQVHNIKILEQWANAKICGDKPWEIRLNDRNYQKGDLVCYQAVTPHAGGYTSDVEHIINNKVYEITYVYSGDGLEKGVVIYSDKDITEDYKANKEKYME